MIVNLAASNDWCFASVTTAVVAATMATIALIILRKTRYPETTIRRIGFLLILVLGVGVGLSFRLTEAEAFRLVFLSNKPEGASQVVADRHYSGGPGDSILFLEFSANESVFQELLSHQKFVRDLGIEQEWLDRQSYDRKRNFWSFVFGGLLPDDHAWRIRPISNRIEVYRGGDGICPRITVLRDDGAQKTYVLYSFG